MNHVFLSHHHSSENLPLQTFRNTVNGKNFFRLLLKRNNFRGFLFVWAFLCFFMLNIHSIPSHPMSRQRHASPHFAPTAHFLFSTDFLASNTFFISISIAWHHKKRTHNWWRHFRMEKVGKNNFPPSQKKKLSTSIHPKSVYLKDENKTLKVTH